jgi:hypothetical protein
MSKAVAAAAASQSADLFDLGQITAVNAGALVIVHPVTGQATGWTITIAGPEHPVTEAVAKELQAENDARSREIEQARVNGRKWKAPDDGEAVRKKMTERLARRILGWSPVSFDGAPFEYNAAHALRLMDEGKFQPIAKQVLDYLADEASFTKRSAKN